jgi:hypothetical protein
MEKIAKMPLYDKDRNIVNYATVDKDNEEKMLAYDWFLSKDGYPSTTVLVKGRPKVIRMSSIVLDIVVRTHPGSAEHRITRRNFIV